MDIENNGPRERATANKETNVKGKWQQTKRTRRKIHTSHRIYKKTKPFLSVAGVYGKEDGDVQAEDVQEDGGDGVE